MDEKDKQIERLFDDYASSLTPNERLAGSALRKMRDKSRTPKKSRAPVWIGAVAACAAVAVVVFSVMSFGGDDGLGGNDGNNSAGSVPTAPLAAQSYSINEVRAVGVDSSFAKDYLDTAGLTNAQVFSENYYACYIKKTDELVYIKAVFGISYNGGNIRMSVIAEKSEYAGKELAEHYKSVMRGSRYAYRTGYDCGEYVTMAYCEQNGYKYYVSAMGNSTGAEYLAADIIGA